LLSDKSKLFLQGFPLGLANTLPGISGGTVAIILYIYEPLLRALKKVNLKFLLPLGLGAAAGALLGALVIDRIIEFYPGPVMALLAGMILASLRVTLKEAGGLEPQKESKDLANYILLVLGLLLALLISGEATSVAASASHLRIFLGGLLGSATMILPGISGGTVLVIMGAYRPVISAIATIDLVPLFFFGLGLVTGLIIFAWLLSWLLQSYRRSIMYFLSGLILGSLRGVTPPAPGAPEITFFLLGFLFVWLITWQTARKST